MGTDSHTAASRRTVLGGAVLAGVGTTLSRTLPAVADTYTPAHYKGGDPLLGAEGAAPGGAVPYGDHPRARR